MKSTTLIMVGIIAVVFVAGIYFSQQHVDFFPSAQYNEKHFTSYDDLSQFIKTRSQQQFYGYDGRVGMEEAALSVAPTAASGGMAKSADSTQRATDYSQTNIQVAGVDEPDIVKNDGKYIYTLSQNKLMIVDAYPADNAKLKSNINFEGKNVYVRDFFVKGDKVIVFGDSWPESEILIYNTMDKTSPYLERNFSVNGSYFDSRMIGNYVYAVVTDYIDLFDGGVVPLPMIREGSSEKQIPATDVAYFDEYDESFAYTYILAINTDTGKLNEKVYMLGSSTELFVSEDNLYTVGMKYLSYKDINEILINKTIIPNVPNDLAVKIRSLQNDTNIEDWELMNKIQNAIEDYAKSLGPEAGASFMKKIQDKLEEARIEIEKMSEISVIHKIGISGSEITYKASGEVPGRALNQFSMDEYDGKFRIATTTGNSWNRDTPSLNHVFVLDESMNVIGKLQDIAKGEQIYSARFMGEKAYLVTFQRTDPLFVIDLSSPSNPRVLGELKIPGFSDYLHPYDATHIIGLGQETDVNGRTTGQLKLAMFDVSDVSAPRQMSVKLIGSTNSYVYSDAFYDHKAFLFDKEKSLLVIPVSENNWEANKYFQGAYVFKVSLSKGIELQGTITHKESTANQQDRYWYDYGSTIRRSLFMDNTLYTVSEAKVQANSLTDLSKISEVDLGYKQEQYPIMYDGVVPMAIEGVAIK